MSLMSAATENVEAPPENLRLAILGAPSAGKTTLLHYLQVIWPPPPNPPTPAPTRLPKSALLARVANSRLTTLFQRFFRLIASVRHLLPDRPHCTESQIAQNGVIWDGTRAGGAPAAANASDCNVDCILLVTRLDEGRLTRLDSLLLQDVLLSFGQEALQNVVFVLTHGGATPPVDLSYQEFVRGRCDLLKRYVREVVPPVEVGVRHASDLSEGREGSRGDGGVETGDAGAEGASSSGSQPGEDQDGDASHSIHISGRRTSAGNMDSQGQGRENARRAEDRAMREKLDLLTKDNDSDDCSLSEAPQDIVGLFYERLVHTDDLRVFADPQQPPAVVVELSGSCPRNAAGERVLPDGKPWLAPLVDVIRKTTMASRERVAAEEQRRAGLVVEPPRLRFWGQLREMVRSLLRDQFRTLVAEIALFVLVIQIGAARKKAEDRRQKERMEAKDGENLVLEISDEEYRKLTSDEWKGKRTVIFDRDKGKGDEDDDSLDEDLFEDMKKKGIKGETIEIEPQQPNGTPDWAGK